MTARKVRYSAPSSKTLSIVLWRLRLSRLLLYYVVLAFPCLENSLYKLRNKSQYCFDRGVSHFAIVVTRSEHAVNMSTHRELSDAELLSVAAATALRPSPSSSPVRLLSSQLNTAHIGTPMDTTTSTTDTHPVFYQSGPHVPYKLLPFDSKQPK